MNSRSVKVGLLGCGHVGSALVRLITENGDAIEARTGVHLEVGRVAVRNLARDRDVALPASIFTHDATAVVTDEDIDIVVEVIGGIEPARELIIEALKAGKPVVTANKELLANFGKELFETAEGSGVDLLFEASVAGGIPLIRPLRESLAGDRIRRVMGIVNGTTNYILTEMATRGSDYADALMDAQMAGYAEADSTGDVEGGDAADKLVVLARLAFGSWLDRSHIHVQRAGGRPGITGVTAGDLSRAAAEGFAIRLLASARRRATDGRIEAAVLSTAVPQASGLGQTNGVRNRIEIMAEHLGRLAVEGPGAGGAATAAAVLADLLAVRRGDGSTWADLPAAAMERSTSLLPKARSYFVGPSGVRYPVDD
jgi:homoserine dehydrogenase